MAACNLMVSLKATCLCLRCDDVGTSPAFATWLNKQSDDTLNLILAFALKTAAQLAPAIVLNGGLQEFCLILLQSCPFLLFMVNGAL